MVRSRTGCEATQAFFAFCDKKIFVRGDSPLFLFGVIRIITCAGVKPVRVAQTVFAF